MPTQATTGDGPIPIQFGIPEDQFQAALAEMQSFDTAHLRECDAEAMRFLESADNEASAAGNGRHDLMLCTNLTGTLAERSQQFSNAHAYRAAAVDLLKTRYHQEATRLMPTPQAPSPANMFGTPYAMLLNALGGDSIVQATREKREVVLPNFGATLFPRVDDGIHPVAAVGTAPTNTLATTSTLEQGNDRGPLSITYILPRTYIAPMFRSVPAPEGVDSITSLSRPSRQTPLPSGQRGPLPPRAQSGPTTRLSS